MGNDQRPRTALAVSELVGGAMVVIGLIVGFTTRTTQFAGTDCGSVLGGGGEELTTTGVTACGKAISTPTTWTWLLLILGVLIFIGGMVIDRLQRSNAAQSDAPHA